MNGGCFPESMREACLWYCAAIPHLGHQLSVDELGTASFRQLVRRLTMELNKLGAALRTSAGALCAFPHGGLAPSLAEPGNDRLPPPNGGKDTCQRERRGDGRVMQDEVEHASHLRHNYAEDKYASTY